MPPPSLSSSSQNQLPPPVLPGTLPDTSTWYAASPPGGIDGAVEALIDGVWGEEPTPGARSTLQTYVSNLRAAIGDIIVREDVGYRLVTEPEHVDAVQFEQAVADAADLVEKDPAEASQRLRAGLALWRGHP